MKNAFTLSADLLKPAPSPSLKKGGNKTLSSPWREREDFLSEQSELRKEGYNVKSPLIPLYKGGKVAFTLAEVLITLGIIGVVAAMTIPVLVGSYQKTAYVTQFRKTLNDITSALDMLITEEGKQSLMQTSFYDTSGSGAPNTDDFVSNHLHVVQTCPKNDESCVPEHKSILGSKISGGIGYKSYLLADGSLIAFCMTSCYDRSPCYGLMIDVNGPKGPNIGGRDTFYVIIDNQATVDRASNESSWTCTSEPFGEGCYMLLVENNWKMNY